MSLPFLFLLKSVVDKHEQKLNHKKKYILPKNLTLNVLFVESLIICKNDTDIRVFSAACSHLGCIINREENGVLICPCHGSQFSLDGKAVKSPASKPLTELKIIKDSKTGEMFVYV